MKRIKTRQEQFRIDYTNELLPAIFKQQSSDCNFTKALLLVDTDDLIENYVCKARLTLLFACNQIKEQSLIESLQRKADSGVRIYLLLGDAEVNQVAIDALSGRCLIRTGVSQCGGLLLIDHTTTQNKGLLLMDERVFIESDKQAWAVQLETQQIDDSFRSFCKLFWEESDHEYLEQNHHQLKTMHPEGQIVTNHTHHLPNSLEKCLADTLQQLCGVSQSSIESGNGTWRLLLGSDSPLISKKARQGVALTDQPIPSLLLSTEGNWLLPNKTDFSIANWCLKLSEPQSQKLVQVFDLAIAEAAWQFQQKTRLGELSDQQTIRFVDQVNLTHRIEQVRMINLDPINAATIDSFIDGQPEDLAADVTNWQRSRLAHQIDFHVVIHPPYCPDDAIEDRLYGDWTRADEDWQKRLSKLEAQQQCVDRQQATIADSLKGFLKNFLLGQGQAIKKQNQEILVLKAWSVVTASPAERIEYQNRLEKLVNEISGRESETIKKLEEAEQNHHWEKQRNNLKKILDEKKQIAVSKASEFSLTQGQKRERQKDADSAFIKGWKTTVDILSPAQLEKIPINGIESNQFLPKQMPEDKEQKKKLEQLAVDESIRAKRNFLMLMESEQAKAWKKTFKEQIWKKDYSSFDKALITFDLTQKKIDRDIQEVEKAVKSSKSDQQSAQNDLDEIGSAFVYQAKKVANALDKQLGLKGSEQSTTSFSWPNDELPAIGTELRSHSKRRYLVIFDTDQLGQGRKDAEMLDATIVCDRESVYA